MPSVPANSSRRNPSASKTSSGSAITRKSIPSFDSSSLQALKRRLRVFHPVRAVRGSGKVSGAAERLLTIAALVEQGGGQGRRCMARDALEEKSLIPSRK